MNIPKSVQNLIAEFEKLPGIGPKGAQRMTYHLLHAPKEEAQALSQAVGELKENTVICQTCFNIAETDPCNICSDPGRDRTKIMVVEEPLDVVALEKTRSYRGLYHVLHGAIAPLSNIGPDELHMKELLPRLSNGEVQEIILATNPTMEGEATAMYLKKLLTTLQIAVTRIARGLPVGGDLEYADEVTLTRSIEGRRTF